MLTSGPSLCHGPKHFFPQHSLEPNKSDLMQKRPPKQGCLVPADAFTMPPMMLMWLIEAQWFGPPQHLPAISSALTISQTLVCSFHRGKENWTWGNISAQCDRATASPNSPSSGSCFFPHTLLFGAKWISFTGKSLFLLPLLFAYLIL